MTTDRVTYSSMSRSLFTNTWSIMSRTTNGSIADVALNSSMQSTPPQKWGHT